MLEDKLNLPNSPGFCSFLKESYNKRVSTGEQKELKFHPGLETAGVFPNVPRGFVYIPVLLDNKQIGIYEFAWDVDDHVFYTAYNGFLEVNYVKRKEINKRFIFVHLRNINGDTNKYTYPTFELDIPFP